MFNSGICTIARAILQRLKDWYKRANGIHPTVEISELLDTVGDAQYANDTGALRKKTLEQMDSRRFHLALPNAKLLYEQHGLRDFDVILGHAYRELGRYEEAKEMYGYYFDRCLKSNSKHLNDASWHLMNILEISEENQEILKLFFPLEEPLCRSREIFPISTASGQSFCKAISGNHMGCSGGDSAY